MTKITLFERASYGHFLWDNVIGNTLIDLPWLTLEIEKLQIDIPKVRFCGIHRSLNQLWIKVVFMKDTPEVPPSI